MTKTKLAETPKGTPRKTAKYYETKIELLEEENAILKNAVEELKSELDKARKSIEGLEEDLSGTWDICTKIENAYIKARTVTNIPGNIEGLVFELLKTRFLLWGEKSNGSKEIYEIDPDKDDTGILTILPPAETFRQGRQRKDAPKGRPKEQTRRN